MSKLPLPCCADAQAQHIADLGHLYHFDFDLFQCKQCARHWVYAFSAYGNGWEPVTEADVQSMRTLSSAELRIFMKQWAQSFN